MKKQVWGHRGARGPNYAPENTLAAFQAAIDAGAAGIELDVQLSHDGRLVVVHDATLARTTGKPGMVADYPLNELKSLRLLGSNGKPTKETIPTLDEVLDLIQPLGSAFVVNIELKGDCTAVPVAKAVARRLENGWQAERFLVSSFAMDRVREFRKLAPSVPVGILFETLSESELELRIAETADIEPETVNIPYRCLTARAAKLIANAGATAVVWTPNESNPNDLPAIEQDALIERMRNEEFVYITDFPKETLGLLKPSWARATARGVLAACLNLNQRNMLFRTNEAGLEALKVPTEYPELRRFGFTETVMRAADGVRFTIWERRGDLDRPHYVLFHGNRAHWGDTGPGDEQRDRRARLKFIEELAASGASVNAVTLRGFGKSADEPSEGGFVLDIQAVAERLLSQKVDPRKLVIVGESLGTWAATQAAVCLTKLGAAPALLCLQNPFTSMAEVGERVVADFPIAKTLNLALTASLLDRHVLKSHFYTGRLFSQLVPTTRVYIATSGNDDLIHPSHSDKLAAVADGRGLTVQRDVFPGALHHNIPPVDFARRLLGLAHKVCGHAAGLIWGGDNSISIPDHRFPCV